MKKSIKFLSFLKPDPDAKKFQNEINEDLENQLKEIARPIAIISFFAWLGFAFDTDPKLHPEFTEIFYFRIGLSIISIIVFFLSYFERLNPIQPYLTYSIAIYSMLSCSFFTGRLADDPNYMSGYMLLILIMAILPNRLTLLYLLYFFSILVFVAAVLIYNPNLSTKAAEYSINNLVIAYVFGFFVALILKNFRVKLFINHLRVNDLKVKQDGDYFLTHLLLQPFSRSREISEFCKIETFIRQKKHFHFKQEDYDIGGDLIIIEKIFLQEEEFNLIVNADAMGKSIQGAGGAIVFNVALEGILERTANGRLKELSPIQWLKLSYKELQKTFEKFQGSMLVSAIIGLINRDGKFFFLNAEHPYPILLRNRKAFFLGQSATHRKLGIEIYDEKDKLVHIHRIQLNKRDLIFIGSDGKDDLELPSFSETELPEINYDETIFLKIVEKANGNLRRIFRYITNTGKITDDISIIKLEFLG